MSRPIPSELLTRVPVAGHALAVWRLDGRPGDHPHSLREYLADPANQYGTLLWSDGHDGIAKAHQVRWTDRNWDYGGPGGRLFADPVPPVPGRQDG
ncbi:hypothetical protein [uncultured Jannaschia sp.]|uniref:hypothetical protein n=1 Tax=uncultured Jannaschia sp. TaxID=293347 RepID=UPI00262848A4|nr:hypothetical protein [uncultured Jannaschia sp.]